MHINFEIVKSALYFIAVLSVLVIAHEWGHFFVAKLFKMRVDDFSLFFGPRLLRLGKYNGTEYNIRSIPLGGFVKIAGMEPEDLTRGTTTLRSEGTGTFMIGLSEETLSSLQADQVSESVKDTVDRAVGEDGKLLDAGREDLKTLLTTPVNPEERRYIQAVLAADAYRPDSDGYNQKPIWQRASVIFAGPLMSLIFGYLIFCVMGFTTGLPELNNEHIAISELQPGMPAEQAGFKNGDWIYGIHGKTVEELAKERSDATRKTVTIFDVTLDEIHENMNIPIQVTVVRGKTPLTFMVTPAPGEDTILVDGKEKKVVQGHLGFAPDQVWSRSGVVEAVQRGNQIIYRQVTGIFESLTPSKVKDSLGGIITISRVIHEEGKRGPERVLFTAAILSVSLGILNLFPIPVLDGGHLVLLLWEWVRRRALTAREMASAQVFGLCVIGILFVLVMYNDIMHLPMFHH